MSKRVRVSVFAPIEEWAEVKRLSTITKIPAHTLAAAGIAIIITIARRGLPDDLAAMLVAEGRHDLIELLRRVAKGGEA